MAGVYKTPGVYIVEKNAFPNSVVEVATAVPAFIGHTERADNKGVSLRNKPFRITSMSEFLLYFGGAPELKFNIEAAPTGAAAAPANDDFFVNDFLIDGKGYLLKLERASRYFLFHAIRLFFQNGGSNCYIVSVGGYADAITPTALQAGVDTLIKEQEPTMVVIPDAMTLAFDDNIALDQHVLLHCGEVMKNRFAILDVPGGYKEIRDAIPPFRDKLGINNLDFGAAYYPWVHTTIVQDEDLSYANVDNADQLKTVLSAEPALATVKGELDKLTPGAAKDAELHKMLYAVSPSYKKVIGTMKGMLNLLPPASAMAGIYSMVDNSRGVWKAPANVSLNSVSAPAVNISHGEQEDLNVTPQGKSINAIRSFIGEGTLVWGARTLDGNSLDWRYVNVRRTMIMLEESVRLATKAYVFEPNVAGTWVTIKGMISNFLTSVWKRGGLAGAVPEDAFAVFCGLGETMTSEDILEGILRVTVLVAISRPAEFIEITFQQQMQKS